MCAVAAVATANATGEGSLGGDHNFVVTPSRDWVGHHDLSFENGYSWELDSVTGAPDYHGSFAEGFELPPGEQDIIGVRLWVTTFPGLYSYQELDLFVWEDGVSAPPGLVLDMVVGTGISIPIYPSVGSREFVVDAQDVTDEVTVGFWVDSREGHEFFILADEGGPGGFPWTKCGPQSGYPEGWDHPNIVDTWEGCECLAIEMNYEAAGGSQDIEDEDGRDAKPHTWAAIKNMFL
jgi:hypothetical protein